MPVTLTRCDPFTGMGELRSRFDRMFDEWLDGHGRAWTPAIDVGREGDHLLLRADLPGIKPEEVKIEVEDDILRVYGEHRESKEEKDQKYVWRERRYGSFSRSMALPPGVDAGKIRAKTHDGVVEVTIPLPEAAKEEPVRITPAAA
jgi:HSP20 family protein